LNQQILALAKVFQQTARAKKRVAGQGEMLMPIAGSGKGKAAAKAEAEKPTGKRKAS
jgi:hypothetical protein